MCATSVIFKPMPKVNNHPLGENSPNLVTLFAAECSCAGKTKTLTQNKNMNMLVTESACLIGFFFVDTGFQIKLAQPGIRLSRAWVKAGRAVEFSKQLPKISPNHFFVKIKQPKCGLHRYMCNKKYCPK
jgi:hypothetical protein